MLHIHLTCIGLLNESLPHKASTFSTGSYYTRSSESIPDVQYLLKDLCRTMYYFSQDFTARASRSGELWTQKLKSHLVRTQSLNVLPLKPGVGHYIDIHATLTARDFFLAYFYPSGPFTCIFPKPPPISVSPDITTSC